MPHDNRGAHEGNIAGLMQRLGLEPRDEEWRSLRRMCFGLSGRNEYNRRQASPPAVTRQRRRRMLTL